MKYTKSFDKLGYFPIKGETIAEWLWRIWRTPSISKSSSVSTQTSISPKPSINLKERIEGFKYV
jgi:hypothetical protein